MIRSFASAATAFFLIAASLSLLSGCWASRGGKATVDPAEMERLERRLDAAERARRDAQAANQRQGQEMRTELQRLRTELESERSGALAREAEMSELLNDAHEEIERLSAELQTARDRASASVSALDAEAMLREIEAALGPLAPVIGLEIVWTKRGQPALSMRADRVFDESVVNVGETARGPLAALAKELAKRAGDWRFAVAGHADNTPIKNLPYRDNTELSFQRAYSVARFLSAESPLPREAAEVWAVGEHAPRLSNETISGRLANRRVEIVPLARPPAEEEGSEPLLEAASLDDSGGAPSE